MKHAFTKRIFTPKLFISDLWFIVRNFIRIVRLFRDKEVEQIVDKTLLVVTGINNCKYCTWIDGKIALKDGIPRKEVLDVLNLQFDTGATEYELPALLYAQNFTETDRNPDPELVSALYTAYGDDLAEKIILTVRVVTFGNMYFNTWLAVISRFKGKPAPKSSVLFEIPYFICNSFKILPFVIWRKYDTNVITKSEWT